MGIAFFLSSEGHLIHVPDSHIGLIIRDPQRFGLSREEVEAAHHKYGERVGVEGEARKGLLLQIIRQGWIRIRRYRNYWSVTALSSDVAVSERLQDWAKKMLSGTNGFKEPDQYMPVKISTIEGEFLYSIGDLAEGSFPG